MKKLSFTVTTSSSPWKTGQSKAIYTTMRLNMTCTAAKWTEGSTVTTANVSTAIFAYMKSGSEYVFDHVCSAMDLADLKTTEGDTWCRKNYIDILFPSFEILNEAVEKIESDIRFLSRDIESYTNAVGTKTQEIGDGYYYST